MRLKGKDAGIRSARPTELPPNQLPALLTVAVAGPDLHVGAVVLIATDDVHTGVGIVLRANAVIPVAFVAKDPALVVIARPAPLQDVGAVGRASPIQVYRQAAVHRAHGKGAVPHVDQVELLVGAVVTVPLVDVGAG